MIPNVGFIGYRGLVGYTLVSRLIYKGDYPNYNFIYFGSTPVLNSTTFSEYDYKLISKCDIILCCKDSDYSYNCYRNLKLLNWSGYWLDASSCFRKCKKSIIVLDPLNKDLILSNLNKRRIYCGGNCTVSIMLLSIIRLLKLGLVDSIYCTSFQSLSGAGFKYLSSVVTISKDILYSTDTYSSKGLLDISLSNNPLYLPLSPWIGNKVGDSSEEEQKGIDETNIILSSIGISKISVFSTCVRVSSIRCHSLSLIIKLNKNLHIRSFLSILRCNKHVVLVGNNANDTITKLNPNYVSGREYIYIGRVRKIASYTYNIFVVGDQLIWGASEPIRRVLNIINSNVFKNKN
ncbi:aspartate-semialdehyde dehydrogenase [Candidatus Vidania fulgoroideorum]